MAEIAGSVVVGKSAALELGIETGMHLAFEGGPAQVVGAVLDTTSRNPQALRWLMSVVPAAGSQAECWVEFSREGFDSGINILWAVFAESGPLLSVAPYRELNEFSINPQTALNDRPQRDAWLLAGPLLVVIAWIVTWVRRTELALYRATGTSSIELGIMHWIEILVLGIVGATSGVLWASSIRMATVLRPLTGDQIAIASRNVASAVALAVALAPTAAIWMGRRNLAAQLKDR
jgi:hypothetical protein